MGAIVTPSGRKYTLSRNAAPILTAGGEEESSPTDHVTTWGPVPSTIFTVRNPAIWPRSAPLT